MKEKFFKRTVTTLLLGIMLLFHSAGYAENIDPYDDDSQYAYGENEGWFNAEPGGDGGDGVEVADSELTGYIWAENIGWINLSPTYGGVTNDGDGNLSGYAWGENVGWINFAPAGGGVTIDANGVFDGWGWGENIGWIHFKSESPVAYKVQTAWASTVSTTSTITSSSSTTTVESTTTTVESTTTTVESTTTTTTAAKYIEVTPTEVKRSRWIPLFWLMYIKGTGTNFALFKTPVSYDSKSVLKLPALFLSPEYICQIVLIMPSLLTGVGFDGSSETVTVTVDGVSDTFEIIMLTAPLDEEKNLQ